LDSNSRPSRFDRQVTAGFPDGRRKAIIELHRRHCTKDVVKNLCRRTVDFSEFARFGPNMLNEATVRRDA